MSKHELYLELCAAASIGEASAEELAMLNEHLAGCPECRQAYSEYMQLAAIGYSLRENPEEVWNQPSESVSHTLREEELSEHRMHGANGVGSHPPAVRNGTAETPIHDQNPKVPHPASFWSVAARAAAVLSVILALLVAYEAGRHQVSRDTPRSSPATTTRPATAKDTSNKLNQLDAALEQQIRALKADLNRVSAQLARSRREQSDSNREQQQIISDREFTIRQLRDEVSQSEQVLAQAREESSRLNSEAALAQANLVSDEARIDQLSGSLAQKTAALEQAHLLLRDGRDIRELMVARNLHIVDVFDTDSRGKTKPAFGRIFFTEGKSLVFYAYDLNEAKLQRANFSYHVWGAREGHDERVRSLGIFYADDKTQRRWVFKCDDPAVLNQIDSVFVTLEPPGSDSNRPRGQRMMDAYLRGVPNHP